MGKPLLMTILQGRKIDTYAASFALFGVAQAYLVGSCISRLIRGWGGNVQGCACHFNHLSRVRG